MASAYNIMHCLGPHNKNDFKYIGRDNVNSLTPWKFEWNFRYVIFKRILVIDGWGNCCEIALIWMSLGSTDDPSILLQGMAWFRQATSHYLSQCWPRPLTPFGVTRPQWINTTVVRAHPNWKTSRPYITFSMILETYTWRTFNVS